MALDGNMLDRRTTLGLLLAAPLSIAAAPDAPRLSKKAARAEFQKVIDLLNARNVDGFLAYGPIKLVDDKTVIDRAALHGFVQDFTRSAGKPGEKPAWIDGKLRRRDLPDGRVLFGISVKRQIWREAWQEEVDFAPVPTIDYPAGYYPEFQLWNVYFTGERITALHRWWRMS